MELRQELRDEKVHNQSNLNKAMGSFGGRLLNVAKKDKKHREILH